MEDATEDFRSEFESLVIAYQDGHALRNDTGTHNRQVLREDVFVYEKHVGTCLLLCTATELEHHVGSFGGSGCFVQE